MPLGSSKSLRARRSLVGPARRVRQRRGLGLDPIGRYIFVGATSMDENIQKANSLTAMRNLPFKHYILVHAEHEVALRKGTALTAKSSISASRMRWDRNLLLRPVAASPQFFLELWGRQRTVSCVTFRKRFGTSKRRRGRCLGSCEDAGQPTGTTAAGATFLGSSICVCPPA